MKRILFIFCMLFSAYSYAQYNPTNFTVSNKSYGPAQYVTTDGRSWYWDATNFVMRDYQSTAEVNAYINVAKYRGGHFPIYIHLGGTLNGNGTYTGGITQVWFYKDGTADGNLVRWYTDSTVITPKVDTIYRKNDSVIGFTINNGPEQTIIIRGTAAGGSINSLTLAAPSILFGTPINFSNSLGAWSGTMTLNNQNPNTFFAGPTSGSPGAPTMRQLVVNDLPINIPNGNLLNTSITFGIGTSGTSPNWSTTSPALGSSTVLNIPLVNSLNTGLATPTQFGYWNQKMDSITISNDSVYKWANGIRTLQGVVTGGGGGSGTVTNFVFTNGGGISGIVTNSTTTPTLALSPSFTGLTFSNGSAFAAATVSSPLTYSAGTLGIQVANTSQNGYLSSADWNTFNGKQSAISLTTTGTTGAATFISNTLNIPQYQGQLTLTTTGTSGAATLIGNTLNIPQYTGGSGITSLNGLTVGTQTFATGTTGTDFGISSSGSIHTFNLPIASGTNTGKLSNTDWTTFNNKQGAVTLTTTGTSGAATFAANTLNIPQYQGALTLTTTGTSGASTLIGNTLNIPQYSGGGGTDTSLAAGYKLAISRSGNQVTYYSTDTTETTIGQIYRAATFPSLGNWVNNGTATFTATGGVITASGGAGLDDFTNSLDYNYFTGSDAWGFSTVLKTGTAAAGVGMSIGIRSTNTFVPASLAIQFDGSNTSHAGRVYIRALRSVNFVRVDSTSALTFTAGDKIEINVIVDRFTLTVFAKNQTTNSAHVSVSHNFALLSSSDVLPNTGKFSIWQHGGANEIDSAAISIYSFKYPAATVLGDSRLYGDYVGDYGYSFVQQLQTRLGSLVNMAKAGDRTGDILNRVPEALSTHTKQFIYMAGVNDIIAGIDTNTIKTNISSTYNALISQGAKVWFLLPWYSSVQDQTWLKNYIVRTYPNYIDTWTPSSTCSDCRATDNIHYNALGNRLLARVALDTNVLLGGRTRLPDSAIVKSVGLWSGNDSVKTVPFANVDNQIMSDNSFVYDPKSRRLGIYPGVGPSSGLIEPAATIDVNTGNMNAGNYLVNHTTGGSMAMGPISLFKTMNGLNFNSAWQAGLDNANLTQFYIGSPNAGAFHLFDRGGNDFINATSASLVSNLTVNGGSVYAGSVNANGPILQLNGGFGSGTGTPGDIVIGLTTTTGSGSTLQSITNRWWFKGSTTGLANKSTPSASATLDLTGATTQGALLPVLNTTQQNAIASPATGLIIYNSDTAGLVDYNGTAWLKERAAGGGGGTLTYTQNATNNNLAISGGNNVNFLTATTSLAGLLDTARAKYIDSARQRLITFTLNVANGLHAPTTDSIVLGGTLNQVTTILQAGNGLTISGSKVTFGDLAATRQWAPGAGITGDIFGIIPATLNDSATAASSTLSPIAAVSITQPTFSATNTGITYTDAYNLLINGTPVASTNITITNPYAFGVIGTSKFTGTVNISGSTTSAYAVKMISGTDPTTTLAGGLTWNGTNLNFGDAGNAKRDLLNGIHNYVHSIFTPATGGTVNLVANNYNIINPSGAIATLTVNLPSSPVNNDVVYIKYTQAVTTVTYGNGTVVDGITTPSAGGLVVLTFDSGTSSWY